MATTDFYVSKGAGANNLNGGAVQLGANDGPIYTSADCSVAGGTPTIVTDNTGGAWGGAAVDDWLVWDTAGVAEWRRITNIAGANATVSAAVTAAANKNVNVGGAWATVDKAASTLSASTVNAAGDPPRACIKSGTYNEYVVIDNAGTASIPITYESIDGDALAIINGTGTNQITFSSAVAMIRFIGIYVQTSDASKSAWYFSGTAYANVLIRCYGKTTGSAFYPFVIGGTYMKVFDCVSVDSVYDGFLIQASGGVYDGLQSYSAGRYGFQTVSYPAQFTNCIVHGSTNDCFYYTHYGLQLRNCIGYGSATGSGVRFTTTQQYAPEIINCIFESNNQYGIESDAALMGIEDYNAFYSNGVGQTLNILFPGTHDVTLTSSAFVNAAGGDLRINNTAGGGDDCRGAGFPGALAELP